MRLIHYRTKVPNFGDDLNAVLWEGLVPGLFDGDPSTGFTGIGTIIGMPCGEVPRLHVFSSGVGNDPIERWRDKQVEYWCVRGPISARILGLPADRAITDGALLVPLLRDYPKAATGTGGTLVIPHFQTLDHPGWPEVAALTGFELLDPRADPLSVIRRIAGARLVLTESLHGAILADVYGIPWIAFATSKHFGIPKWIDWTASIGRDLDLHIVPPPDPGPVLAYGRPAGPYGQRLRFDAAAGLAQFRERIGPVAAPAPVSLKARLKAALKRSPLARSLLGLSPARTAEALTRLAGAEPALSEARLREELRDRMVARLGALAAAQGRRLAA
ncbi:polysaccharide pyruvyl transferase family protein [Roseicella aerolata]|uniref:Polysaccharide pyruvyl transferase family protein n=1 Tax=Roseicella aerolata TaxID=2883479 RepID=A0A9X1IGM8_9PROT|nr:polysaccharide pyruvyl transferase family protein [Roseicella aerolata]MCB4824250.1 polysaccharide pyruvyl transferase family protein [Roseicella aerolata]